MGKIDILKSFFQMDIHIKKNKNSNNLTNISQVASVLHILISNYSFLHP